MPRQQEIPDPALAALEQWLRVVAALCWNGRLELQINGRRCVHLTFAPDLPLFDELPAIDPLAPLAAEQDQVLRRIARRLAANPETLPPTSWIYIPIQGGVPGEPREKVRIDIHPGGKNG